jgi:hypothetical protein
MNIGAGYPQLIVIAFQTQNPAVDRNVVNLIENARSSHEFHECHETLSLSVAPFLALFVYFVQFVAVLVLPKQEFHLKLMALGRSP